MSLDFDEHKRPMFQEIRQFFINEKNKKYLMRMK